MKRSRSARPALNLCFGALVGLSAFAVSPQGALAQDAPPADSVEAKSGDAAPATDEKAPKKEEKAPKKEEKVKTGVIANTGNFGFGPQTIDSADGGAAPGEDPSVVTGGVSQIGNGKCSASLTNSSEDNSYSVSYSVVGYNNRGVKALNKSFSATLKPGETNKRELPCQDGLNMALELRSARKR